MDLFLDFPILSFSNNNLYMFLEGAFVLYKTVSFFLNQVIEKKTQDRCDLDDKNFHNFLTLERMWNKANIKSPVLYHLTWSFKAQDEDNILWFSTIAILCANFF